LSVKDWTIDTWVLYQIDDPDNLHAENFLMQVLNKKNLVVLDREGNIEKQYRECIFSPKVSRPFLRKWFKNIQKKNLIYYFEGRLTNKHEQDLLNLKFDRSDIPFVAVCYQTTSKDLVTEDSDFYTVQVKTYLNKEMQIQVLTIQQAVAKI
jgi:hypothetical protein